MQNVCNDNFNFLQNESRYASVAESADAHV